MTEVQPDKQAEPRAEPVQSGLEQMERSIAAALRVLNPTSRNLPLRSDKE